ncbi:MAG: gliding motility protein GldC [Bacteroidota bacterium]
MDQEVKKTSEIKIKIGLNEDNVPVKMEWKSEDQPNTQQFIECKAMLLSLFDKTTRDTMKIDLWTTEMQILEMDRFFYQSLRALADTYFKATKNNQLATDMQRFVQYFGEQTEILPKSNS